jgi:hypothetical protein
MVLTPEARRHVRAIYAYYEERDRPEAGRALRNALTAARRADRSRASWPDFCYTAGMERDQAIARLKEHEAELRQLGIEHLYLFGSRGFRR